MGLPSSCAFAPPTILVVDDEADLLALLEYNLRQAGFRVCKASDGQSAVERARDERPSLIVLDIMLPDLSGVEVCRTLRGQQETADIPILFLTARGEDPAKELGFQAGADDYVTKPFNLKELIYRIRAILKRTGTAGRVYDLPGLRVEPEAHRVWVSEREISLTRTEFKLLVALLERRGRVQSRERLLDDVWDYSEWTTSRTVDTHVTRLREKLGEAGRLIQTVRGVGYRLQSDPMGE